MIDDTPTLYVMDISYFSGKVEAYLRFAELEYRRVHVTHRSLVGTVGRETGVAQVPAMKLANGRWLRESSEMIRWLESDQALPAATPADRGEAFLALLVEDYCDEWLWRPAMWWRWRPERAREELSMRIAREVLPDLPLPAALLGRVFAKRQEHAWLAGDGMGTERDAAVQDAYYVELDALQGVLASRPFLGGGRPNMMDIGYMGPMFRHFSSDPESSEVMRERAPLVWDWVQRMWTTRLSALPADAAFQSPAGAEFDALFSRVCRIYLPYLKENALAVRDGRRRFDFSAGPFHFRGTRANQHRAQCRAALRRAFASLRETEQEQVRDRLEPAGGLGCLLDEPIAEDQLPAPLALPLVAQEQLSLGDRLRLLVGDSFGG